MQTTFNRWRDKTRHFLHRFSQTLGETLSVAPTPCLAQKKAKAAMTLDMPAISSLLPYETMDDDQLFINRTTLGFGLEIAPRAGADESLMKSMAELFKNKLPVGVDCTVMLYKHPYLNQQLTQSYAPIIERGGVYAELSRMSLQYHLQAIDEGYANSRNVPAQLVDYRAYLFLSMRAKGEGQDTLKALREDWESELKVAGFSYVRMRRQDFLTVMTTLISPQPSSPHWPSIDEGDDVIAEALPNPSTVYAIHEASLDVSLDDESGCRHTTRVINCEITQWPKQDFALWQTPDLFANLLRPEAGIQCPFLISFTIRGVSQEKIKQLAKARTKSLVANANAIQTFLHPGMVDEACEWQWVHQESAKGNLDLLPTFYNVMLLTTAEKEREHVAKAISAYRQLGFKLVQSRCKQWLRYLGSLPFLLSEGLFEPFERLGLTKKLSHYNVANLLPLIADFKGCQQGLLLPTYRHQVFFYDPFDDHHLPITNYNRLTVASPGAGKSYLQQALILDGLSRGHQIFVIDLGDSYKHLCQLVGGTYLDATRITLNPFTLFDFEGVTDIKGEEVNNYLQIRDLLAIMASPEQGLDEVQKDWLLKAILVCWQRVGKKTCMDDVLDALKAIQAQSARVDNRLSDLLILLSKYGREGIYSAICQGETPLLNESKFTVLEMGGFQSNPQLLTIVMFMMIIVIQGQFYHADRRLKKQCIIDEVWRFLAVGSNPIAANFIEQGYRTARKYQAGFSVITQNLNDTEKTAQGQAIAASSDTKMIMRQGAFKSFLEKHPTVFSPLQAKMIESFGEAKAQGFSNLMLQFGTVYTFHRYFSDPFSRVLFSTSGDEFGDIEALMATGVSLVEAVSRVAKKYYGDN